MSVLFGQMEPPEKQIGKKMVFFFQCWCLALFKTSEGSGTIISPCNHNLHEFELVGGINKYVILYSESI